MQNNSQRPKWIKRSEALGGDSISFNGQVCNNVIPTAVLPEHLCSNEVLEVDLITGGKGICRIFGQSVPCGHGDVFVIPPDVPHNCFVYSNGEEMHVSRLLFDVGDWFGYRLYIHMNCINFRKWLLLKSL